MSLEFTLVRRAISLAVIDGPDAGDNPDILKAQGSVLFEPVIKKGDSIQVQTRGGSQTYALAPIECPINDGIISHRGQDGVKLPAGGEAANPSLIRWKATFSRMQAGGKSFTLAPVIFDAVPGGEIDLTMVAPVAGAPEGVVRGPRGTSLESIIVDGSELVFTAVDDAGSFEIARIPLDDMVRAEAEAAADGVRDALAVDVAASQSARDAAEGHANRAATSESNAAASESAAKQSETNAGDYAAVATTAATEAVGAMERATEVVGGDFATREHVDEVTAQLSGDVEKATKELESRLVLGSGSDGSRSIGPAGSTFPWYPGLVTFDDFRSPGEVVGASSFSGATWSGSGSWLSDGTVARPVGSSRLAVQAGLPDISTEVSAEMETSRTGTAQTWRLYLAASSATAEDGVWVGISISATGVASCSAYITSRGSSRQLAGYTGLSSIGVSADTQGFTPVRFDVDISGKAVAIKAIGKAGEVELSGELTPEELENLGEWVIVRAFTGETPGFALSKMLVETDQRTPPEPVRLATVDDSGTISEKVVPERLSEQSLLQLIKAQQPSAAGSGLDALATKIAFSGAGQHSIGVVSDSSMNDGNDSLRIFDRMLAARLPSPVRHVYHNWNTADADWRDTVNVQGEMTPGHDGNVLTDTFSRVADPLVGSAPDVGAAWQGSGAWSADGQHARASSRGRLSADAGDRSMKVDLDLQVVLEDATSQRLDLILAAPSLSSSGGILVAMGVGSTGALMITPYLWDGKWVRFGDNISAGSIGISPGSPAAALTVSAEVDIQNVSVEVTGPNGTFRTSGQLSESQYAVAGTWTQIVATTSDTTAFALDKVVVSTAPQPPQGDSLDVWNGALAGAKLASFDAARIESMFGGKNIDILIVSMGHNHGTQTPSEFLAELESWIGLWKGLHPETEYVVWVSQNPQFPPAASVLAHRDRQHAVRLAHNDLGMDYVGGYEAIASQPDGGSALILTDGIHPTTPPIGVIEGDYGAVKVAEAIMESVNARI